MARQVVQRAIRRVLATSQRVGRAAAELRTPRRTVLRVRPDRASPPPSAFARFGTGSWIVPPIRLTGTHGIEVGAGVIVLEGAGVTVAVDEGARLVIGDGTRISKGAEIVCSVGVTIGARVSTSDYVGITDSWSLLSGPSGDAACPPPAPVTIEDGAYLGWGSIVGPGVRIGAGAYVGEGAVVLEDVPPHHVVYGNPARVVRRYEPATSGWAEVGSA